MLTIYKQAFEAAIGVSMLSPCRSKRGAVVFGKSGIVSTGYNHPPQQMVCDRSDRCKKTCGRTAIHAEQHAIIEVIGGGDLSDSGIMHVKTVDGQPVGSGPPSCLECSKLILEAGFRSMYLVHDFGFPLDKKRTNPVLYLQELKLQIVAYQPVDFHAMTIEFLQREGKL